MNMNKNNFPQDKSHLKTDTGEKPYYACEYCNKSFYRKKHLNGHLSIHTGEKPFPCDYCSKSFHRKGHLNKHIKFTHTGPYSCDYCSQSFSDEAYLTTHLRIHTGEKPYQCFHCSERFIGTGYRNIHMKICPFKNSRRGKPTPKFQSEKTS